MTNDDGGDVVRVPIPRVLPNMGHHAAEDLCGIKANRPLETPHNATHIVHVQITPFGGASSP